MVRLPALSAAELKAEPFLFAGDARAASGAQIANATPDGRETNLARAIAQTLTQAASPPLAIVALTDGVATVDEKSLRVLFVQGGLTWDYKFIRIALQGDPTIELSGLSRVSSESVFLQSVDNSVNLASGFPATLEQLAAFRVVVLSNLRSRDLTQNQQELLARFCGELGGGVLMIGGAGTFDVSWRRSRLEELLPVRFSPRARRRFRGQPVRLWITDQALAHPVFQISGAADNRAAWSKLPTFARFASVDSVKPGAQVWAVCATGRNVADRPAVIASQRYGAGLTAVICVQNFWRWRLAQDSDPQHFDRFWRQLLRYLGEGNRAAVAIRLPDQRLEPDADIRLVLERRPEPTGATAAVYHCRVTDAANRRVTDQTVELRAGRAVDVRFHADRPGLFQKKPCHLKQTQIGNVVGRGWGRGAPPPNSLARPRRRFARRNVCLILLLAMTALTAMTAGTASTALAQPPGDRLTTFFVGRVRYGNNRGGDCAGVGRNMVNLMSQVSTVPTSQEKRISLADAALFATPFLFMNGHNDFVLTDVELGNLRVYLEHGGFLFASGCCTNPAFPKAWRRELARVFPGETVRSLDYSHPIYRAFYKINRVRNLHQNKEVHLEGLFLRDRMVAVLCEDGLCCAFSMDNRCNVGRGVSPEDGKKLALNIAVYAMTH